MNKQVWKMIVRDAITALTIGLVVGFSIGLGFFLLR